MNAESAAGAEAGGIELSVVMPCLNEADTIAVCVEKAVRALRLAGIQGEVLVADNGSSDGSQELARAAGARVVAVASRGYGNALMGGIAASRGRYVLIGDADDSYDFLELGKFVTALRKGAELVQGCRLPSGGGTVLPNAMPWLHRYLGNPLFSFLARWWFRAPIHDIYCGLRGFTRELYDRLEQRCTGMEFATEMVIKASLGGARIAEVPITLHPDGRRSHPPHLRTWRDGWRTLRFFLMCSPRWLFLIPGISLMLLGTVAMGLVLAGAVLGGWHLGAHSLVVASLFLVTGYQCVWFAVFAKTFAAVEGLIPPDPRIAAFYHWATLERGIALGAMATIAGLALILHASWIWSDGGYGDLPYPIGMRYVVPGATLVTLGVQTVFASFLVSILGLQRR